MTETNPVAQLRTVRDQNVIYKVICLWCPGCEITDPDKHKHGGLHWLPISGKKKWDWNGNLIKVTLSPSILTKMHRGDNEFVCHSFLQDGQWRFLGDCTHALANQVVPMVPSPDWAIK